MQIILQRSSRYLRRTGLATSGIQSQCLFPPAQSILLSEPCSRLTSPAEHRLANSRTFCNDNKKEDLQQGTAGHGEFKEVFSIPDKFLSVGRRIQLMKLLSLSVTTVSFGLGVTEPTTAVYASLFGLSGVTIAFIVMGNYVQSLACKMYLNPDKNQLKISSLNFFGRRKDTVEDIDKVLTELNGEETKIYMKASNKKFLIHVGAFSPAQKAEFDKYF